MVHTSLLLFGPKLLPIVLVFAWALLSLPPAWSQALSSGSAEVITPSVLRVEGKTWTLFGVRGLPVGARCTRRGGEFDCGQHVIGMLRDKIGTQRVSCEARSPAEAPEVTGVCSIGAEDIATWLVRSGWAWADAGKSVNYLVDETYARIQRAGMWEPDVKLVR